MTHQRGPDAPSLPIGGDGERAQYLDGNESSRGI